MACPICRWSARLAYFSNGVTASSDACRFRAAACTGALYHVETYLICGDLEGLEAGVYHFGAHDTGSASCRVGLPFLVASATVTSRTFNKRPLVAAFTSTWWRNA